jgi:haloalkane dehalogenase
LCSPPWLQPDLFPFRRRFIDVRGNRLHYVDEGDGPVLLLLHGNPTWSFLYRGITSELRGRFRCIAPDLPGFGLSRAAAGFDFRPASQARVLGYFVDSLALTDVTPMLHDWGGPIGLWVAARQPARIRALIIANSWAWPVAHLSRLAGFSRVLGGPLGRLLIRRLNLFVELGLRVGVRRRPLSKAVLAAYRGPFPTPESRMPTYVLPREITGSRDFLAGVEGLLPALSDKPVLILWGDRDPAFRAGDRHRFEALFPRHVTRLLSGAGHFVQVDASEDIVQAITVFAMSGFVDLH